MLQLRVLSGHHKGAILNLDENQQNTYALGCDDYSDVLLVDIGIEPQHLRFLYENHQWFMETEHDVREENGCFLIGRNLIQLYKRFYLSGVWLGFADADDDWATLEPLPDTDFLNQAHLNLDDFLSNDVDFNATKNQSVAADIAATKPAASIKTKFLAIIALLSLAGWATANVFLKDSNPQDKLNISTKNQQNAEVQAQTQTPKRVQQTFSRRELAKLLTDKLVKLDLNQYLEYEYNADGWVIKTSLDEEERMRLERAIEQFNQDYAPKFAISVQSISKKNRLGVSISQVVLGRLAGIVTQEGQRLYVGDEINGYRLVSVTASKVVFDGPEKVELIP